MTSIIVAEGVVVLAAWAFAGYMIWRWGPGLRKRSVHCPKLKTSAKVLADQREAEFACLRVADITACSLLTSSSTTCEKQCLARL